MYYIKYIKLAIIPNVHSNSNVNHTILYPSLRIESIQLTVEWMICILRIYDLGVLGAQF